MAKNYTPAPINYTPVPKGYVVPKAAAPAPVNYTPVPQGYVPPKVATPAKKAVLPTVNQAATAVTQPAATDQTQTNMNALGNLKASLRAALNEASRKRIENNYKTVAPNGINTPGTVGSVVDLIKSGVKTPVESTFKDIIDTFKEAQKALETDPSNFRNLQGGLYDIKNNRWIVNPKPTGSSGSKKVLTRADVKDLGLPLSLVGTNWNMLETQLDSSTPPDWFTELYEKTMQNESPANAAYGQQKLAQAWDEFRSNVSLDYVDSNDDEDFFDSL